MKRNKIWIFGIFITVCLSGCTILQETEDIEVKRNVKELKNMAGGLQQVLDDVKTEIADTKTEVTQKLNNINWAEEVFLIGDTLEREKLVLIRTDLKEPQKVAKTKDFISDMKVKEWKKVDTLPMKQIPLAIYDDMMILQKKR